MNDITRMLPYDAQLAIEHSFSKKHIDGYLMLELTDPGFSPVIDKGVQLLEEWLNQDYYASKQQRLDQIRELNLRELTLKVLRGICYLTRPELFTSVSAKLAGELGFSDKPQAIATMAEILAVLCGTDAYDIVKPDRQASLLVVNRIQLEERTRAYLDNATFLPPMVCEPNVVEHNRMSGYLTHNDSLVLGRGNHHDGELCLDVINRQNRIPLKLDLAFMKQHDLQPSHELVTPEQREQWEAFRSQTFQLALLMNQHGNRFYLTHKVDKRGRLYSVGYHITTQGSQYQKAMLEFAEEEIVEGV